MPHVLTMRVLTGTSGFSYDEWHGTFYPKALPADERLRHYASCLHTVEINNSFYQMPKAFLLERWRESVPNDFKFALKAPRRLTHAQRLKGSEESLAYFLKAATSLAEQLAPVLFQLPPFLRKDTALLDEFLGLLPESLLSVFEFRHPSWYDDEVFTLLASKNAALCLGDSDGDTRVPPFVATANFGYLRLRAPSYDAPALRAWSERILGESWSQAFVYMKHEVFGPEYAQFLDAVAVGAAEPPLTTVPAATAVNELKPPKKGLARTKPSEPSQKAAQARTRATRKKTA